MPALDHRLIRLEVSPDEFRAELIETAERGRTGRATLEGLNACPHTFNCEEHLVPWGAPAIAAVVVAVTSLFLT
ncbi:hypothetical protein G4Z16_03905 [Streptomyces bathyalis]|uniref:Uncharacterized protein n=1 Tax=Streptomyces bathyalis TaxID=2710756 RepID=A0A7T1T253_9ACTN|nr:hypothetical protein [Streptomyces bathyalis]QPP05012.1 hypothetical protein G4Z16_03905 [Streptomyces bathyalis]